MSRRAETLETPTYPAVSSGCLSVYRLLRQAGLRQARIGARILGFNQSSGEILLAGQTENLLVTVDSTCQLSHGGSPFETLAIGDFVELDIFDLCGPPWRAKSRGQWVRLVPSLLEPKLRLEAIADHRQWIAFARDLSEILTMIGLERVETPTLVSCPGTEPSLRAFATEIFDAAGRSVQKVFLPTSPELHLKKCLAQGWTDIFEISKSYRNGESGPHHELEFWMLEWYRAFANLDMIEADWREILAGLVTRGWTSATEIRRSSMRELFQLHLDFDLRPDTQAADLQRLARHQGWYMEGLTDFRDLFSLCFLEGIEPHLADGSCWLIRDFPPSERALSRLTANGWADRLEIYWRGMELANGFHEINDPQEQAECFAKDLADRTRLGTGAISIDEEFMSSLKSGMPPAAGIALGIERLFIACRGWSNIQKARLFPRGSVG